MFHRIVRQSVTLIQLFHKSQLKRWCLMSISRTPASMRVLSFFLIFLELSGSSLFSDRLNDHWLNNLKQYLGLWNGKDTIIGILPHSLCNVDSDWMPCPNCDGFKRYLTTSQFKTFYNHSETNIYTVTNIKNTRNFTLKSWQNNVT